MQTERPKSNPKLRMKSIGLAVAATLLLTTASNAATLYGVTGDGANTPETLFTLSKTDASASFHLTLGAGNDGETIGFNPADGLMYHSSGWVPGGGPMAWESIDLGAPSIVSSGLFTGPDIVDENTAMVYDTATSTFLVAERLNAFFSATTAGVASTIGTTPEPIKGLAFVGNTLYGSPRDGAPLYTLYQPTELLTLKSIPTTEPK